MAENNSEGMPARLTFDALLLVFEYLSIPDLEACSKVCQEWREVVNSILEVRRWIQAFMFESSPVKRKKALWRKGKITIRKKKKKNLKNRTPSILSDALLTLVFNNRKNVDNSNKFVMTNEFIEVFAKCRMYRPLNTNTNYSAVVRFPPHAQVIIKTIKLDYGSKISVSGIEEKIGIPTDVKIQAVILFCNNKFKRTEIVLNNITIVHQYVDKQKCAFAGCSVDPDSTNSAISIIVFAGENVEAESCVLEDSIWINNCDKIRFFSHLVTPIFLNSILLVFSPESERPRNKSFQAIPMEYAMILKECFPRSGIFGCNGANQYGVDYIPYVPVKKVRFCKFGLENETKTMLLYIGYRYMGDYLIKFLEEHCL